MRIINKLLLDEFRAQAECELCGRQLRHPAEPHHIHTRGAGQLDIEVNLIALGGFDDCKCHEKAQNGIIPLRCVLAVVALRTGWTPEAIVDEVHRLRRATRDGNEPRRPGVRNG